MEHSMRLHENEQLFRQAISATADKLGIDVIFVEKDYWVTYALKEIFNSKASEYTVFKGGTSLAKCYNLIDRFSEDIDLVVLKSDGDSNNRLTTKIKTIGEVVSAILPEVQIDGITHKMGMNRKTAHSFPKLFKGNFGQVRSEIIVEATWLGYYEPYTTRQISTLVAEMMFKTKQDAIADEYDLMPFEVRVLEPIRTICEKIMSLVRFSYTENPIADLGRKIRHTYDLHQLLKQKEFQEFFSSKKFDAMLLKVAADDVISFKNNNNWLQHHPKNAIIFASLEEVWNVIKDIYINNFSDLVYGGLPNEQEIYKTLELIKERLGQVDWQIDLNE